MNRILITGASGFIGKNLAVRLAQQNHALRCIYRRQHPPKELTVLHSQDVELVKSDITESQNLPKITQNINTLIHIAGKVGDWGTDAEFHQSNVIGVRQLYQAAKDSGVQKIIHLSSVAVQGFGPHQGSLEQGPRYAAVNPYQTSKYLGEQEALKFQSKTMSVSVIRPGNVYGPGDKTTTYPLLEALEKRIIPTIDDGVHRTCPVYIDDVIDAILALMESETAQGEVFNIIGPESPSWKEYLQCMVDELGVSPPFWNIPSSWAMNIARILERVYHRFNIPSAPPLTIYRVAQLSHDYVFSSEKAHQCFGYTPHRGLKEGMKATVQAYRWSQRVE
ncbi:MAG: NAD-dependent epimerase/dehydratase family protein [Spirochaetales bacterium]|nr:NAD-dependent epimerase/dehydratase family protein [Spirochaetales bacterium]